MATLQDDKDPDNFLSTHENLRRGDIVGVVGTPSRTKKGELSISPSKRSFSLQICTNSPQVTLV
jgi:lysyl-tRNA synthetase class 2